MALRKVTTGEPVQIKATTWNAFVDAAIYTKQQQRAGGVPIASGTEYPATTVLVRNNTGSDLSAYAVVGISGPIILPSDNEDEFKQRSGWTVVTPTADHVGSFLVTAESIPAGEMGIAYSGGVVPVLCQVDNTHMDRADVNAGNSSKLIAGFHGAAQILWKAGTGTSVWTAIRMGNPTTTSVVGTANGTIVAGGIGQITVFRNGVSTGYVLEGVHLDWMHGSEDISSGKEVMATYFPYEKRWRITGAECE